MVLVPLMNIFVSDINSLIFEWIHYDGTWNTWKTIDIQIPVTLENNYLTIQTNYHASIDTTSTANDVTARRFSCGVAVTTKDNSHIVIADRYNKWIFLIGY